MVHTVLTNYVFVSSFGLKIKILQVLVKIVSLKVLFTCMHACMYLCMYVCMYVCM